MTRLITALCGAILGVMCGAMVYAWDLESQTLNPDGSAETCRIWRDGNEMQVQCTTPPVLYCYERMREAMKAMDDVLSRPIETRTTALGELMIIADPPMAQWRETVKECIP